MKNPFKREPRVKADPNRKPEKVDYTYVKGPVRKKKPDGQDKKD